MDQIVEQTVEQAVEGTQEATAQATQQAVSDVSTLIRYFQNHLPDIIAFGIRVVLAIIVFIIARLIIGIIRKIIGKMLEKSTTDVGVRQFIDSLVKYILYALVIFTIATKFGVDTASVAALIASAGVAVGLALQGSLSNFAGGILILLLKPFAVGDYIVEDNHGREGVVEEIQLFYTKLTTIDNRVVVIPNGMLTNNSLTNVTKKGQRRLEIKVGIAYESDLKLAKEILYNLMMIEDKIDHDKEMIVFVDELGDDGVVLGVRCWVNVSDFFPVRWDLLEKIKLSFDEEGIEIPYHKMDVHISSNSQNSEKAV